MAQSPSTATASAPPPSRRLPLASPTPRSPGAQTRGTEGVLELSVCSPAGSSEGPASMPPWGTEASPTLSCLLFCMLFSKISNGVFFQQHRWRALSPDTECRARLCPVLQELTLHRDAPSLPAVVAQSLLPGLCPATWPCPTEVPIPSPGDSRVPPPSAVHSWGEGSFDADTRCPLSPSVRDLKSESVL